MKLYDLALADNDVRPSPWCWLAKFAMLHKGAAFETEPVHFADKTKYPDRDHGRVPVLVSGEETITDSARIVAWLEKNVAGDPFTTTNAERAACDFYQAWVGARIYPFLGPMLFVKVWAHAHENDKEYFRTSREERFGKTLEESAATPGLVDNLETSLQTLAGPLARHKFLGGEKPNLADYQVMSPFMWQRSVSSGALYDAPQAVDAWKERMLDLFDGYGRNAKSAE